MFRTCGCAHGFPVCACALGLTGPELLRESNRLSSLAGWPGKVTAESYAEFAPHPPAAVDQPAPPRAAKPRGSLADAVRLARDCVPCRERRSG